jgi:PAS domain S-box-containing protein
MVAKGDSLAQILESLCQLVEERTSGVLASILLIEDGLLRQGGAPSLPKAYIEAIDGVAIGPSVGSCGTAAYRREQVIVEDIATDPLWADYRAAALSHSLRACWSTPIFSSQGKVIATFAMYYRERRSPSLLDQEIIEQITHLAGVAIERKLTHESLRRSEAYLAEAQKLTKTGSWAYNPFTGRTIYWSDEIFRIFGLKLEEGPSSEKFWQLLHPDDLERVRKRVEGEANEKKEYVDEYRIVLRDRTIKYILDIGHPVFNDAGDVVEFVGTTVDITERKRAEEDLRRSESYLAEAQRMTHTGSWVYDPVAEKPVYWSEEAFHIYGLDPQKIVPPNHKEFVQLVHPDDRHKFRGNVTNTIREARSSREKAEFTQEYRVVLPDGTIRHIHEIGHPVRNEAGELVEFVGTSMDVTERKHAEETLCRSEAYLAEAQRLTQTGSFALDPDTLEPHYLSDEVIRMWGYNPEDGLLTRGQILDRFHPADRDKAIDVTDKCRLNKTDLEDEFRIVLPGGRLKYIHRIVHAVLDAAGEVVELIGTNVDVTERKRAEEELHASETRFRISVDHLTDALFIHDDQDDQGRIIDANQQAFESLGYTREELTGMTAADIDAIQDATFMQVVKDRLVRGEIFCFETVHRRKDGTEFPVEVRVRPFWHGDHRFGLALARDITDRKRAEQERERLRHVEEDLARINRVSTLGELTASIAHEIRQPIAAIISSADTSLRWLSRNPPNLERARLAITRVSEDGIRASEVINRLRSLYTKVGPRQRELLDVNEVANEMLVLLRSEANRYSISMRTELTAGLSKVKADRVQLQQVFMNLMLNGIEAMKDTGGDLTIKSDRTDNGRLLISVADTGVGLPTEGADQIFDAFYTTKPEGTGMGLAITRSIVESHGGRLWAAANNGPGATLNFTLSITGEASR